jgi:hypothetical protein
MQGEVIRCSKDPTHTRFFTSAREFHTWIVDERGDFIEDRGCDDVDSVCDDIRECAEPDCDGHGYWTLPPSVLDDLASLAPKEKK